MIKLQPLQHHSEEDWSFLYAPDWAEYTGWFYTATQFISPPHSLWFGDKYIEAYALSRHPLAQNMLSGRLTCWVRSQIYGVGQPWYYIGVTGPGSSGIRLYPYFANNVWLRTRFTWWQGKDDEENDKTVVLRERWVAEEWVEPTTLYYDPMAGNVNRVGIGSTPQSVGNLRWYDDTIIERWFNEPGG